MQTFFILLGVVALIAVIYLWFYHGSTPPVAMFGEIRDAITQLQRNAAENITPLEKADQITGFSEELLERQSIHVGETIRFVYTITESPTGIVHVISSQLIRSKPQKYQIQCMLVAMVTLNQQLSDAGIDPETVEFDIDQSALGTQYLTMSVTREQHDQIMATVPVG